MKLTLCPNGGKEYIGSNKGYVCTNLQSETVGVVSYEWWQSICIKGRAACPMVEKVGITPFRLADREDWRERETQGKWGV